MDKLNHEIPSTANVWGRVVVGEEWADERIKKLEAERDALRAENERLRQQLVDQNTDGCGWKPVAEDALRLLRELIDDNYNWFDDLYIGNVTDQQDKFDDWLAQARAALGEKDAS